MPASPLHLRGASLTQERPHDCNRNNGTTSYQGANVTLQHVYGQQLCPKYGEKGSLARTRDRMGSSLAMPHGLPGALGLPAKPWILLKPVLCGHAQDPRSASPCSKHFHCFLFVWLFWTKPCPLLHPLHIYVLTQQPSEPQNGAVSEAGSLGR